MNELMVIFQSLKGVTHARIYKNLTDTQLGDKVDYWMSIKSSLDIYGDPPVLYLMDKKSAKAKGFLKGE